MKPAPFAYHQPTEIQQISAALAQADQSSKILAGGQSLGPMLNLRLAQPGRLIDITRIPSLKTVEQSAKGVILGACVTHANIEDGCVPGRIGEVLAEIARGIAFRAVRNRGTIGGSLAHADPSADWVTTLMALDAELGIRGSSGLRWRPLAGAMRGPFDIGLAADEWIESIRIPNIAPSSVWSYTKLARKTGEFAHAMVALLHEPSKSTLRIVFGATEAAPVVINCADDLITRHDLSGLTSTAEVQLRAAGLVDPLDNQVRLTVMQRTVLKAKQSRH
jgi:carbon-monoxide dehydrogenase medium subunit